MEDSAKMTIEFLRARLLSERSLSRTARQRADQQAKRVMELEEKLRFVSIQRKKAERVAAEVISILETQGIIHDFSEEIDSSSEEEEDARCDKNLKEYESSNTSRLERNEVEIELSGSEPEISNSQGKSLSWKSHCKSPDSSINQISKELRQRQRQRSFFSALQLSPKQRFGKSCRRIMPRDIGLEADSERYRCGNECSCNCDDHHDECGEDHKEEIVQRDWEDKFNKNVPSVLPNSTVSDMVGTQVQVSKDYHGKIRNKLQNEVAHYDGYASKSKPHPNSTTPGQNHTETSNEVGDILEALQFAKMALSRELSKLPSSDENAPTMSTGNFNIDIPFDSASLFRLPTDTFPDVFLSMPNFLDRELNLPTARPYFERGSRNVAG